MKTECVVIQIGNSDDKLTQKEWAQYNFHVTTMLHGFAIETHFAGASNGTASWQNACWVVVIPRDERESLFVNLRGIAKQFRQDSIAVMVGETEFLKSAANTQKGE